MTGIKAVPLRKCVGIMLFNKDYKVWTGKRIATANIRPVEKLWQMPQGGIDKGEQPIEAAVRELEEEIGTNNASLIAEHPQWLDYTFSAELSKHAFKGKYGGQTQKWFAMRFEGRDEEIDISGGTDHKPEFSHWQWQDIEKLTDMVVPFKREVYKSVVEEFRTIIKE